MTQPIGSELLARYFEGTATPAEADLVRSWIGDNPERRAAVAELAAAWASDTRRLTAPYDADSAWARMAAKLTLPAPTPARRSARTAARNWSAPPITAWAALVMMAVAWGGWWLTKRHVQQPGADVVAARPERTYRTDRAQRAIVRLSDGSEVTLNAASQLRIPAEFGEGKRELHLVGEAYFNVAHDSSATFIVHTARGSAHALGTRFNVRAYGDDQRKLLEVVVAEGRVSLSSATGRDSLVLRATEAGWLTGDGQVRAERGIDVHALLGWIDGRLDFKNVQLRDVLPVMARWYDADLSVGDSTLADYPITVSLSGERLEEAIELVALALNARVVQRGTPPQTVFLRKSGGS